LHAVDARVFAGEQSAEEIEVVDAQGEGARLLGSQDAALRRARAADGLPRQEDLRKLSLAVEQSPESIASPTSMPASST
jgi:hypothetical protein